jgi:hypothetical protein
MAAFTALAELAYYVAPDGSDSSAGTPESPFRTLQKARDAIRGLSVDE